MRVTKRLIAPLVLFSICISFFIFRNIEGFGGLPFSDESGHFLGVLAMQHGDRLYRDYIDAHGPLVFMLSWILGPVAGVSHLWVFRLVSTLMASLAGLAIFCTPLFTFNWQRYLATAMWVGGIASVWTVQGLHLDSYWPIGGALTVISMATFVVPLCLNKPVSEPQAFCGGFATALLPFAAYAFGPLAVLFYATPCLIWAFNRSAYKETLKWVTLGCPCACLVMTLWLAVYGDIGGMIAFHIIANQRWYAHYIPFGMDAFLHGMALSFAPDRIIETLAVITIGFGSFLLVWKSTYKVCALLAICGLMTLQIRGMDGFQNGAFLMAAFGLASLMATACLKNRPNILSFLAFGSIGGIFFSSQHALSSPWGQTLAQRRATEWHLTQDDSVDFAKTIRAYTRPDERILAVPYNPDAYLLAHRLPIKKYHAYLPWEADYAAHPWHGYDRDLCTDLPKDKPPAIYFDSWVIWGVHDPKKFMPCVVDILRTDYTQVPAGSSVYIRNDRLPHLPS
ncbi:hypothetical protein ACJRO0_07500 [Acetobacter oryzifermentans]|uniref:hypothetical protein n=1 Tax=Acetobacter oryzifermentans TaxID=1633874 RepID=UPI0039BFF191